MLESSSTETLHSSGRHDVDAGQRVAFRLATASDIDAYYGLRPPQTLRGIILTLDDQPSAVIGLANEGGYLKLFSEYKPEFKPYLRSMTTLRAIKAVMQLVAECKLPVVAVTQPNEPDSPRLLERLGFAYNYTFDDGDIYQWHPCSAQLHSHNRRE